MTIGWVFPEKSWEESAEEQIEDSSQFEGTGFIFLWSACDCLTKSV